MSIRLYTVQGFSYWSMTHVGEKVFERLQPPRANLNSTAAVILVLDAIRIETTLFHFDPTNIGRSSFPSSVPAVN